MRCHKNTFVFLASFAGGLIGSIASTAEADSHGIVLPSPAELILGEAAVRQVDRSGDDDVPNSPWRITVGLGAAYSKTTDQSASLNFNAAFTREDEMSKWDTTLKYIYNNDSGSVDDNFGLIQTTYLRRFRPESVWGWFGQGSYQYNATESYRTRTKGFLGAFYLFSQTERLKLAGKLGAGLTKDRNGNTDFVPRTLTGWTLDWRINSLVSMTSTGSIENDIGALEDYFLVGEVRFNITISEVKNLALYLTIRDEYDSNPEPGDSWNQIWITTGLNFTF